LPKLFIIGGGPAGMMAAIAAKKYHPDLNVVLLEKNAILGKKLKTTGGGRCNITAKATNEEIINNTPKNGKFLFSTLNNFNAFDIIDFFSSYNCPLKTEDHARMFPQSNQAQDIIDTLLKVLRDLRITINYNTNVLDIDTKNRILIAENQNFNYDYLILATGGKCVPASGSNGDGYRFAQKFQHSITELKPAEVPLVSNDAIIQSKQLQGLSFKDVTITVHKNNKSFKKITHDLLFTHFGLSGPAALRASFFVYDLLLTNKDILITIDFLPKLSLGKLETILQDPQTLEKNLIQYNIPKRLINYLLSIPASNNTQYLAKYFKQFPLTIVATRGFSQAIVTNGGVAVKEIIPKTMKSKLNETLAFAGELIDINSYTGGYNITTALSTGYTAGKYIIDNK